MALCLLCTAQAAQASAWNPEAWHGELISGYVQTTATEGVDEFGQRTELQTYRKRTSQNYGMLGLTDRVALLGAMDWQAVQIETDGLRAAFSKPSKIQAGLQYQVARTDSRAVALSVSYLDGIDLPLALLSLESREPSVEVRALWGESRQWGGRNVFAEAQVSGAVEVGGRYSATQAQLTAGVEPVARTQLLGKLRYVRQEGGTLERLAIAPQQRWEVEASAVYRLRGTNYLEVGYSGVVGARNAVRESGIKVGVWSKF